MDGSVLGEPNGAQEWFGIRHASREVTQQPCEPFNGDEFVDGEAGFVEFNAKFFRPMEVRPKGSVHHVGWVLTQASRDAPIKANPDIGLVEQLLRRCVEDPRVPANDLGQERAAGAQHTMRFA